MPDISKINALDIGSVSKVDGLAKASILDIDGIAVPPAVPAPSAAYSVRLLGSGVGISSYTGPAMRVRRDTAGGTGDDDEADIAFDSGVISLDSAISNTTSSASTLGQFLNVGTVGGTTYTNPDSLSVTASCLVTEWKDQSGNTNHASQATFVSQPEIHSGTVNTDLISENGKPTVLFQPSKNLESSLTTSPTSSITGTSFRVLNKTGTGDRFMANLTQINAAYLGLARSGSGVTTIYSGFEPGVTPDFYINGTSFDLDNNNAGDLWTALPTQALTTGVWTIVAQNPAIAYAFGYGGAYDDFASQEYIIFESDQSTNRTGIESDINGFFGIY